MSSRQGVVAEHGSVAAGRDIIVQFGLTGTPASFRGRVQRFLSYYLGSESRPVPFGGRGTQLEQLNGWLADSKAPPNLLITAPAGRGKTALLVHWLQSIDAAAWPVAFVPISVRFETNRPDIFYQALATRLGDVLGRKPDEAKGDAAAVYKDKIIEQLDAFVTSGKRCLLAIDGLDEATGWQVDTSVLPPDPIPGLRVIASARLLGGDFGPQDWLHRLGWRCNETYTLEVPPLDREGIADVLREMGVPLADLAGDVDLLGELQRLTEGDPLLLRFYVEDLWQNRDHAAGLRPEGLHARKKGFGPYFREWLNKQGGVYRAQGAAFDEQTIKAILLVLACAFGPLRLANLVLLVRRLLDSKRIISRDSLEPIQRFLISGSREEGYALGHPKLGEYLRDDFFGESEDVARARAVFLAWGSDTVRRLNVGEMASEEAPPYLLQFYAQHLSVMKAGPDQFRELVEDGWRQAWEANQRGLEGFVGDVRAAWCRIREETARDPIRLQMPRIGLGGQIRCVLCLSSIRSSGRGIPPALLVEAVRHHLLGVNQALYLAKFQPPQPQVEALIALTEQLPEAHRPPVLQVALDAARAIGNEWHRAEALIAVAQRLVAEEQPAVLAQALGTARAIRNEWHHAEALAALAPHLPPELLSEALAAACRIAEEHLRTETLAALAPHLPPDLLAQALDAARTIGDEHCRASALTALAPHLPADERPAVLAQALDAARAIREDERRAEAFATLAQRLPLEERLAVLADALDAARAIVHEWRGARALIGLAPHLPPKLLPRALDAARAIREDESRAEAIAALAPHLPADLLAHALDAARAIRNQWSRADALTSLAPHLPPDLLAQTLDVARAIGADWHRAKALTDLAPHLPSERQPAVLAEALDAACAIREDWNRAGALTALVPYLPADLLAQALDTACAIEGDGDRAGALTSLAPHLPSDLLAQALDAARTIGDEPRRAGALAALAERLPPEEQSAVLVQALDAARAIEAERSRADVLVILAERLPPEEQSAVLAQALDAACAIREDGSRASALSALVPHLPAELLFQALDAARAITAERSRAGALSAVAARLVDVELAPAFNVLLAECARLSRAEAIAVLLGSVDGIWKLGGATALSEMAQAICDVGRWWP